jgi:hypothetical protein
MAKLAASTNAQPTRIAVIVGILQSIVLLVRSSTGSGFRIALLGIARSLKNYAKRVDGPIDESNPIDVQIKRELGQLSGTVKL